MPPKKQNKKNPRQKHPFGIALSGGAARGLIQLGILEVLDEEGIQIDCISGSSMGAVIGAAYALGVPPKKILEACTVLGQDKIVKLRNLNLFNHSLLKPEPFIKVVEGLLDDKRFEDCHIPFRALAVDLESGSQVVFKSGPLRQAVMASSAMPFIFPPLFYQDRLLVDGGLIDNTPLDLLAEFSPKVTMAVEIRNSASKQKLSAAIFENYYAPKLSNILKPRGWLRRIEANFELLGDIIMRTIEIAVYTRLDKYIRTFSPTLLISPESDIHFLDFSKAEEAYLLGKKIMHENLPELKKLLGIS